MYDIEALAGLLPFIGGGAPPVFEEFEAVAFGPYPADEAAEGYHVSAYTPPDGGVFDLSTPQGRAAWKANGCAGVVRIVPEDGDAWLQRLIETVQEGVAVWMEAEGIVL